VIPASSLEVRERLLEALRLDLVGPYPGHALAEEKLQSWKRPSNEYLTGFLVPTGTPPEKRADADENEDFELVPESAGLAEESNEERKAAKKAYFPSSMGLSFLVHKEAHALTVTARWGDYELVEIEGTDGKSASVWQRRPREERLTVALAGDETPRVQDVPDSGGLQLHVAERPIETDELGERFPRGTRSVSVFLVNRRTPHPDNPDLAYAFQAEIEVQGDRPFVPRSDPRGLRETGRQVADLHYRHAGARDRHGPAEWEIGRACHPSAPDPSADVEKTATVDIQGQRAMSPRPRQRRR
jgi:hypothetical protein